MLPRVDTWYRRCTMLSCGPKSDKNRFTMYARDSARDLNTQAATLLQTTSWSEPLRCIPEDLMRTLEVLWLDQNLVF